MKVATKRLLEEQIAAVVVPGRGEKSDAMWHVPHCDRTSVHLRSSSLQNLTAPQDFYSLVGISVDRS